MLPILFLLILKKHSVFIYSAMCLGKLKNALSLSASIGHAKCIRWILAVVPALNMMVLEPMADFFFQHIEEDEGLMHIADTVGMLTPERKSGFFGSTESLEAGSGSFGKHNFFGRQRSTSNVGLAYDASPISRHNQEGLPSPLLFPPPPFLDTSEQHIPLKKRKSVHFGLIDNAKQSAR